jgi:transcriptional activator SPT8
MEDADDLEADIDQEGEGDGDGDGEGDDDDDDDNGDDEEGGDDEEDSPDLPTTRRPSLPTTNASPEDAPTLGQSNGGPTSHPNPLLTRTSASPRDPATPSQSARFRYQVRPEALTASLYDIVPTIAAPQSTSINAIAATPDMRFWFSGGADGYIRKYDGVASVNGKTLLTVAQRHPFVDSVVKAGVLMTYWDNEEPLSKLPGEDPALSPVYSLAVQSQALWMLSGLDSGAINLYSVRHDEGKRITFLSKHKSAVSVLTLAQDEKSVLSGSWDKNVFDWDLNTGQVKRSFEGSGGQISAIEIRPASTLSVPEESGETVAIKDSKTFTNGTLTNGANGHNADEGNDDAPGSPTDSLFGGGSDANSLFGETAGDGAPSGGNFGDEDDEFSRAIGVELENHDHDAQGDLIMGDADTNLDTNAANTSTPSSEPQPSQAIDFATTNGASHADSTIPSQAPAGTQDAIATSDSTFLAASMDGTLRVWDRRQPNPIAKIPARTGIPPWCMAACWSPDGNYIYAGRRNGTVEEFSLHKGLRAPERTFKFPQGSGAVSALRAMPNGRHLIWYIPTL